MLSTYYKKLISLLTSIEKKRLIILFILMIIGSFLEVAGIGTLPLFIAVLAKPEILEKYPMIHNSLMNLGIENSSELLIAGSILIITVFIIKNIYLSFLNYQKAKTIFDIQLRMSHDLFVAYLKAPYTFHLGRNSSELLSNVYDCVKIMITGILMPFMTVAMEALLIVITVGMLLSVETVITLSTISIFGAAGYIYLRATKKKSVHFGLELQKLRGFVYRVVYEGFGGTKEIKVLNREEYYVDQFHRSSEKTAKAQIHQSYVSGLTKPILETIAIIMMLLVAIFLMLKNDSIDTVLPLLALFGFASVRLMPSINQIISGYSSIRYSFSAIDPLYEDFNQLRSTSSAKIENQPINILSFEHEIRFENVSYQYPTAENPSLKEINLTIPKGKAIGFVGSSGAGKTTIIDIILGLLSPVNGKVLIDKKDLQEHISSWQKKIGYIPQHIFLSDNTVRNNIALGIAEHEIDDTKIWNAIRLAQLDTLINELPDGIHTEIGERGVRFSGGQRQRIGIARALYHNPEVLIMDEATSALDNITEKYIVEEIERLKGVRTIIIIAHRLTTVQNCDTIHYMEKGSIVDSGTYTELIEKNPSFKKLALIQH